MKLVRLTQNDEVKYFTNPTITARYLGVSRPAVMQALKFESRCKGWYVEIVDGGEVMAKEINKNME